MTMRRVTVFKTTEKIPMVSMATSAWLCQCHLNTLNFYFSVEKARSLINITLSVHIISTFARTAIVMLSGLLLPSCAILTCI